MLFAAHSGLRYLVLLAGIAAAIVTLIGWRRGGVERGLERGLTAGFVGVLDLQVLLGIVLVTQRPFFGALMGHIVMMVLAAAAAHTGSIRAKRRAVDGGAANRVRFVAIVAALVLIVGGIMAIGRAVI